MMSKFKAIVLVLFVTFLGGLSFAQAQTTIQAPQPENISEAELGKFANAYQNVQKENQKAQEKMVKIITDKGMEIERFTTIQEAASNPDQSMEATDAEIKTHESIMAEIKEMQPLIEAKMEKAIADSGISKDRFQTIGAALQQDKALQQRFQTLMMGATKQQ